MTAREIVTVTTNDTGSLDAVTEHTAMAVMAAESESLMIRARGGEVAARAGYQIESWDDASGMLVPQHGSVIVTIEGDPTELYSAAFERPFTARTVVVVDQQIAWVPPQAFLPLGRGEIIYVPLAARLRYLFDAGAVRGTSYLIAPPAFGHGLPIRTPAKNGHSFFQYRVARLRQVAQTIDAPA